MKKILLFVAYLISICNDSQAQCNAPTAATYTINPANCAGQGSVSITSVTGGSGTYEYALYDSINTNVVKPFQTSNLIAQVARGKYYIRVRSVCTSPAGYSTPFSTTQINVSGTSQPLIAPVTVLSDDACGNGKASVAATGGYPGTSGYQYALVPTQGEPEPVAAYVRPLRSSNVFDSLTAGTYYARVYDSCGTYTTTAFSIAAAPVSATNPITYSIRNFYSCDSINGYFVVTLKDGKQTSAIDPRERFWMTYSFGATTITDTLSGYASGVSTMSAQYHVPASFANQYPLTLTAGYKTVCGNIYTRTVVVNKPKLKIILSSTSSINCTTRTYTFQVVDSLNQGFMNNFYYSKDSGTTWRFSASYYVQDTFINGQTYYLAARTGCDTGRLTVQAVAPVFNLNFAEANNWGCNGKSGFYIAGNSSIPGSSDSMRIEVISAPTPQSTLSPFYNIQNAYNTLTKNLDTGTYILKSTSTCGDITYDTVRINHPANMKVTISPSFSCNVSNSGFTVNILDSNVITTGGWATQFRIRVLNSAQQVVSDNTSYPSGNTMTRTISNIPNGTYTIRVSRNTTGASDPSFKSYDTLCPIILTYNNTSNQALTLSQSLFTSGCANGTATILAIAQGGGGKYTYSLYNGSGSSATQIGASQASGLFNNLVPNQVYEVRVTDSCGNGTQFSSSFSNVPLPLYTSSQTYPCPGQSFILSVSSYPGAAYAWQKNTAPISGASTESYTINPVPNTTTTDTFRAMVTLGNCNLFSKTFLLDPNRCGQPLPVTLAQLRGRWNADHRAVLDWEVYHETAVQAYEVQYSKDAQIFLPAGRIAANGWQQYSFTDELRNEATLYYRLAILEKDGRQNYTPVLKLAGNATSDNRFSVYPTTPQNELHITYNAIADDQVEWLIVNTGGITMRKGVLAAGKGMNAFTLQALNDLPAGVYLIRLQNNAGYRQSERFILIK